MMRNIFKQTNSNDQDDLELDSSEEEDLDMLSQNDLDGITEANQAMKYDSDTSNDEVMDCEEVSLKISHNTKGKSSTYQCS